MSYSRWFDSRYYTYWDASLSGKFKNNQYFTVMAAGTFSFSYKNLNNNIEKCLDIFEKEEGFDSPAYREELKEYMKNFIDDMNIEFSLIYRIKKYFINKKFRKKYCKRTYRSNLLTFTFPRHKDVAENKNNIII